MRFTIYTILFSFITFFSADKAQAQCTAAVLSVYNITDDSATLSWTAVSSQGYEYSILAATSAAPGTGIATTATTVNTGNLNPGTPYKAWLRTNCGSGVYTPWTSISFSTPCGVPSTITATNIWADSAIITWTSVSPSANYQYVVDTASATPATGTSISTNTVTVKNLLSNTVYYAFVRTDCGNSVYSAWSASQSFFSAFPVGINTAAIQANAVVFPNPVNDKLYINGLQEGYAFSIYNTLGIIVWNGLASGVQTSVDMSTYPAGVYILKYTTGTGSRFVKIEKH